jgi:hypothetical protein
MPDRRVATVWRAALPWMVLASVAGIAVWHVFDFSEAPELDFPRVVRPFFNTLPPAAYRLAEPGDSLDRIGLYFASAASALALVAIGFRLRSGGEEGPGGLALWPTALALGLAATWHASTPGPTFDGWHGLGWRILLDPAVAIGTRSALAAFALGLIGIIVANLAGAWPARGDWMARGREVGIRGLLATSAVLVALRQVEVPGVEPVGYWPRCAFDLGVLAFGLALIRARPLGDRRWDVRRSLGFAMACGLLVLSGVGLTAYHRPISRLRAVVPGKIYIGAMPSYLGLSIEQERLHFRTIIDLFDESSTQASPHHEDELRFVREHGLGYLGSPSDGMESDRFLDETLAIARDPDAWPILVHCHGCMDRSPAWMGIYRFLVEGRPLAEVFREIERHRGSRPKAVVTLQYNRKLPPRAPGRFEADPTAQVLRRCVEGTRDPFLRADWNRTVTGRRVVTRIERDPSTRRP